MVLGYRYSIITYVKHTFEIYLPSSSKYDSELIQCRRQNLWDSVTFHHPIVSLSPFLSPCPILNKYIFVDNLQMKTTLEKLHNGIQIGVNYRLYSVEYVSFSNDDKIFLMSSSNPVVEWPDIFIYTSNYLQMNEQIKIN